MTDEAMLTFRSGSPDSRRRERALAFQLDIAKGLLDDHGLLVDYDEALEEAMNEAGWQALEPEREGE